MISRLWRQWATVSSHVYMKALWFQNSAKSTPAQIRPKSAQHTQNKISNRTVRFDTCSSLFLVHTVTIITFKPYIRIKWNYQQNTYLSEADPMKAFFKLRRTVTFLSCSSWGDDYGTPILTVPHNNGGCWHHRLQSTVQLFEDDHWGHGFPAALEERGGQGRANGCLEAAFSLLLLDDSYTILTNFVNLFIWPPSSLQARHVSSEETREILVLDLKELVGSGGLYFLIT